MQDYAVAFLGFGNVGQALGRLFDSKRAELAARFNVSVRTPGVATRTQGWWASPGGLMAWSPRVGGTQCYDVGDWLMPARADVVFETLPLDPTAGQPALDYTIEALELGATVVSANKGPVVHGYQR